MLLSSDGKLYICGDSEYGVFGINNTSPVLLSLFKDKFIKKIWCSSHCFALTSKNELYCWGDNYSSQLGFNSTEHQSTPQLLSIPSETVLEVTTGWSHSLFLCKSQKVYGCGSNYLWQLSLPKYQFYIQPAEIPFLSDKNIIQITAGGKHSLFLSKDYKIWGTGHNEFGQLGLSFTTNQEKCVLLKTKEKIIKIECCGHKSFFLSLSGNVYACGLNDSGSMGILNYNIKVTVPTLIQSNEKFQDISCGKFHCLFLTTKGEVYTAGKNDKGQLGSDVSEETNKLVKVKIKRLFNLKLPKRLNKMRVKEKLIDCIVK